MKVLLISNFCNNPSVENILDGMVENKTGDAAIELLDNFPINIEAMFGNPLDILRGFNGKYMHIRSADFPNVVWLYGTNNEPLQLELVDVDCSRNWKIKVEKNKEVIQYLD